MVEGVGQVSKGRMVKMVRKDKYSAVDISGTGERLFEEDEDTFWRKVVYFQRTSFLLFIPALITTWIWMEGSLLKVSDESDLPRAVISWSGFILTCVIVSIIVYLMSIQHTMENLIFYDNGIKFALMDWMSGPFTVHLPC